MGLAGDGELARGDGSWHQKCIQDLIPLYIILRSEQKPLLASQDLIPNLE